MSAADDQIPRLEHLLAMGKRLAAAIEADITALERGAFQDLRSTDPEIAKLAALYAREVATVKAAGGIGDAPAALVAALKETSVRLKAGLLRHDRLVRPSCSTSCETALCGDSSRAATRRTRSATSP